MRNVKALRVFTATLVTASMVTSTAAFAGENAYSVDMTAGNEDAWARVAMANDDTVTTGINIRSSYSEDSEIVGYLYRGGAVTVLDQGDTWTEIESGNVTGYIKNEYLVYGAEAKGLAEYYGTYGVQASWDDVHVFAENNADAQIIATVDDDASFMFVSNDDHWIMVQNGADSVAYVSSEDVSPVILMNSAVSVDDVQTNAAAEKYAAARTNTGSTAAAAAAAGQSAETGAASRSEASYTKDTHTEEASYTEEAAYTEEASYTEDTYTEEVSYTEASAYTEEASYTEDTSYTDTSYTDTSYTETSYTDTYTDTASTDTAYEETYTDTSYTDTGSADTSYTETEAAQTEASYTYVEPSTDGMSLSEKAQTLYNAYVEAQNAADNAVANGASEQTIVDTAAAAQQAYAVYVAAQNAADEASWGTSADTASDSTGTTDTSTDTWTDTADTSADTWTDTTDTSTDTWTDTTADTASDSTAETYTEETEAASTTASTSELELLAALIYCEAGNQPYEGQVAVGAVVMNRVASASFPGSIYGVIYASGQFTPAYSGALASALANGSGSAYLDAASAAMAGEDPTGGALYFNTHQGSGLKIGAHWFF